MSCGPPARLGSDWAGPSQASVTSTGNGSSELAASSGRDDAEGARAWLLYGASGISGVYTEADAGTTVLGANTELEGEGIAGAFDLNGDGISDPMFSAWDASAGQGQAWLAYGR